MASIYCLIHLLTPNELAKNIDASTVKADYILITHGHEDHIADAISIANALKLRLFVITKSTFGSISKALRTFTQ
jgi:L-ascorbate metabolism protein UlaG (beta-lactamase superfamily)